MYELDAAATHAINALAERSVVVDVLMIWISSIGIPLLVLAVAVQWWRRTDRPHTRHVLVAAGLSFLLGLALNQLVLLFVHRMRPYDGGVTHLLITRSADYSFPSDHATASFAIAAAFLLHRMRRMGLWFLAAAVLVAVSRVYIGTHYASDVLGGALTGIFAAMIVNMVYREGTRIDRFITSILLDSSDGVRPAAPFRNAGRRGEALASRSRRHAANWRLEIGNALSFAGRQESCWLAGCARASF